MLFTVRRERVALLHVRVVIDVIASNGRTQGLRVPFHYPRTERSRQSQRSVSGNFS